MPTPDHDPPRVSLTDTLRHEILRVLSANLTLILAEKPQALPRAIREYAEAIRIVEGAPQEADAVPSILRQLVRDAVP